MTSVPTTTVPTNDLDFLRDQPKDKLNMILAGMTDLMGENTLKTEQLNRQGWFQRMCLTVLGRNKATAEDIRANHEKLNAYMAEVIGEMALRFKLDESVMLNLGARVNELCAEQTKFKTLLGAFSQKLNKKIEDVDNFNMLLNEIRQGVYTEGPHVASLCRVVAQLSSLSLASTRKVDLICRELASAGVLGDDPVPLTTLLDEVSQIPVEDAGLIDLTMQPLSQKNLFARLVRETLAEYQFLPQMDRELKNRESIIASIVAAETLDESAAMSTRDLFERLLEAKTEMYELTNSALSLDRGRSAVGEMPDGGQKQSGQPSTAASAKVETPQVPAAAPAAPVAPQTVPSGEGEELRRAERDFLDGKYEAARKAFTVLAEKGDARAMVLLAECCERGLGGDKNDRAFAGWLERAKDGGDSLARLRLAEKMPPTFAARQSMLFEAVFDELEQELRDDDAFAQFALARMCQKGWGRPRNIRRALRLYKSASDLGHTGAMLALGQCYLESEGLARDPVKAVELFTRAAGKGDAQAMYNLAVCFQTGTGIEQSHIKAVEWCSKADSLGFSGPMTKLILAGA